MKCFTPMVRAYMVNEKEIRATGDKAWQRIIPRSQVFSNLQKDENYLTRIQDKNYELEKSGSYIRYQLIPCKNCWACQLKYAAEWASRIVWETKYHEHNYFITLTYDEEHVPIYEKFKYIDKEGKETIYENDGTWSGTLEPKDMDRFINTLRKYYERQGIKGIKYFYCGEYGNEGTGNSMGYRPHYHLILMGAPLNLKEFYDFHVDSKHKKLHWKSHELDRFWGNKGFIDIAEVEWSNAAYTARYCMKKIDNERDPKVYAEKGKMKEYIRMSRNPGIGTRYYQEHKEEIYELDGVTQRTVKGNVSWFKPPKAWDRKFKEEFPEWWDEIQKSRSECAERDRLYKKELYKGISDREQLEREAEKTMSKGKMLQRVVGCD